MQEVIGSQNFKRHIAFKFRIGNILSGKPIFEAERMRYLEINEKRVSRVNIIANIVDKYIQEGEKKYGSLAIDDGTGQIRAKLFADDVDKLNEFEQGDTVMIIGLLRNWNNEVYITPEIIKKKDPRFLLIRKLEIEAEQPKVFNKEKIIELKDKITNMVKMEDASGGADIEKIIMELKESPDLISQEIKRMLEDGIIYEPRPGKLRYLG